MSEPSSPRSSRRAVLRSRRRVAILFTDVEGSTELWEKQGDVAGRLLVDRHNRLVFPLIRRFRGKVLKTIGDSVMASFRRTDDAVRAAIAIQQGLARARDLDPDLELHVRIGIHAGLALVEHGDVYGDVVNVASRIEARAARDQILISAAAARGLDRRALGLTSAGSFRPKGKRRPIRLLCARWQTCDDLSAAGAPAELLPVYGHQRLELAACAALTGAGIYLLYALQLRYLIADSQRLALLQHAARQLGPAWPIGIGVGLLALALWRVRRVPELALRLLQGGAGFALGFALLLGVSSLGWQALDARIAWSKSLHESRHLLVEIVEDGTLVREQPDLSSPVLRRLDRGALLRLADVETGPLTWNRVWLGPELYGYVARHIPARPGAPAKRLSISRKHIFTLRDGIALAVGGLGFLLGVLRFRLRPA